MGLDAWEGIRRSGVKIGRDQKEWGKDKKG